jgi:hypothetical protein
MNVSGTNGPPTPQMPTAFLDTVAYDVLKPQAHPGTILYRGVGTLGWQKLEPGTAGQVLTTGGLVNPPFWSAGSGVVNLDSFCATQGAVIFRSANIWQCLLPGSSGQVMTSQGPSADVIWATFAASFGQQNANTMLAGPSSGAAATPTFRGLVAADLPFPTATTIGGVKSYAAVTNQFVTSLLTDGTFVSAQPSFTNLLGAVACSQLPSLTGDVTTSAGSCTDQIVANAVTNSKLAAMPANTLKGNNTGALTNAADITVTQLKTMFAYSFSDLSGSNSCAQLPTFTGDVTTPGASCVFALGGHVVTNAKMAQMAAATFKGNSTAATADATDFTISGLTASTTPDTANDYLIIWDHTANTLKKINPNTIASAAVAGVASLGGATGAIGLGAELAISGSNLDIAANGVTYAMFQQVAASSLVGNPTGSLATPQGITLAPRLNFSGTTLDMTNLAGAAGPTGSATVAPIVTVDNYGRVTALTSATIAPPFSAITGNYTFAQGPSIANSTILGNNSGGSGPPLALTAGQAKSVLAVGFSDVSGQATLGQLPSIASNTGLGNITGGAAVPAALTPTQITANLVNNCTNTLKGAVPMPPNDATKYLDGTCNFTAPAGGNTTPSVLNSMSGAQIADVQSGACTLDLSTTINQAIVNLQGGVGTLYFPPGVYCVASPVVIRTGVYLNGAGPKATIIRAKAGTATQLLQTLNFATLVGTNTTGGPYKWGLSNMSFDGNKANVSSTAHNLALYGYDYVLNNIASYNSTLDGIYAEWATSPTVPVAGGGDAMDSKIINSKTFSNNGLGIEFYGPHDTFFVNFTSFLNTGLGMAFATTANFSANGVVLQGVHSYGNFAGGIYINASDMLGTTIIAESNNNSNGACSFCGGLIMGAQGSLFAANVFVYNNSGLGAFIAGTGSTITNFVSTLNTGVGIQLGGNSNDINMARVTNNGAQGFNITGNNNIVFGARTFGNFMGGVSNTGTGNMLYNITALQ